MARVGGGRGWPLRPCELPARSRYTISCELDCGPASGAGSMSNCREKNNRKGFSASMPPRVAASERKDTVCFMRLDGGYLCKIQEITR